mmetsp:Transcript_36183/g.50231  ORF Transcript_36183/g.50231 Transcript_36183/m.50231 type:complete len:257 (+) Transcript_36183:292-1062(+)
MLVQQTVARNQILLASYQARMEKQQDDKEQKTKVKPEDMVKLCDNLLTNLAGLSDSLTSTQGGQEVAVAACAGQEAALRGWRAFYLAKVYWERSSHAAAYLLYGAAKEHATRGIACTSATNLESDPTHASLMALLSSARAQRLEVHAGEVLRVLKEEEEVDQGVRSLEVSSAQRAVKSLWLLDNLDQFQSFAGKGKPSGGGGVLLMQTPPPFLPTPAGPIVLDTALNEIEFPSLESRVRPTQQNKGISRFFGWGRS